MALRDRVADAAGAHAVLDGDHEPVRGGQRRPAPAGTGPDPARVDHGHAVALLAEPGRDLDAEVAERADATQQHVLAVGLG